MSVNRRGVRWSSLLLSILLPLTAVIGLLPRHTAVSLSSLALPSPTPALVLDVVIGEIAWMGTTTDSCQRQLEMPIPFP
ncbi:MAG: hypothetical protein KA362_02975 [Chloroflexi bacterium]|nr:hypothetical protein [Chloroflexota bacterium]